MHVVSVCDLACRRPLHRKWYLGLVQRALGRPRIVGEYYERHHILPRALGGTNQKENIAVLTFREHFLAHWLLASFTDGEDRRKMRAALFCLIQVNGKRCWVAWQLAVAREAGRLIHLGKKRAAITGQRISAAKRGVGFTEAHRAALRRGVVNRDPATRRGPPHRPLSAEHSAAIAAGLKDKPKTHLHGARVGAALREVWKRPGYKRSPTPAAQSGLGKAPGKIWA
jgi:hypothetical protein